MTAKLSEVNKSISLARLIPVLILYFVWGSTYLAIRIVVREGSGFPPFAAASSRFLAAGTLIIVWGVLAKRRMKPNRDELLTMALAGVLMLALGNGMVNWAEQRTDSGLAALLVAAVPIWTILIEAAQDRNLPSVLLAGSILVGFGGIALLAVPGMIQGEPAEVLSILALLLAGFTWALGSARQSRRPVSLDPIISSGYQMLFGGVGLILFSALNREPFPAPRTDAWLAWGYLVVFGSITAFTAYVIALKTLPIQLVMTYTYINPVIAVLLGWLILGETITWWTVGGTALVLLGVAGVFRERRRKS
ncbi:MAG: EamA family transporter [Anaerolineales bacterium]|nr:EamA family transporter [Anaerolineales bacterium]